jgi:glycosyltransferase involved in cell wall biosynthesis
VSGFGSTGVRNRITADGAPGQVGTVHVVVPDGIDDPLRPSGGNAYDRRICAGLAVLGWSVREHAIPGPWPRPDSASRERLTRVIAALPDGAVVLLDGLIASAVPEVLVPESGRLRLVVLVHLPLGHPPAGEQAAAAEAGVSARERAVLTAAARVVTTSSWTRGWLVDRYALRPSRIHVATPGVDAADPAPGSAAGSELLCVAAVTPGKGHDVLLAALASVADLPWRLSCVGSLTRDPDFADRVGRQARTEGIADRVCLTGALAVADLDRMYAAADMLVLASRGETYGMVVTEALARGLPVIASAAGGIPEAVGQGTDGVRPGILVPAGDPAALAAALRDWLTDAGLRQRMRSVALDRRATLSGWSDTSATLFRVLAEVAA